MTTTDAQASSNNSKINQFVSSSSLSSVTTSIKLAADETGVDFTYLLKKAIQESNLNPLASSAVSTAKGLFQFTNQTWLSCVKNFGARHGLGLYADHISVDSHGIAKVTDPNWHNTILNLRSDPKISAVMAGELDKQNLATLRQNVTGPIGPTDLYLAHFLGATGASHFLNALQSKPSSNASSLLPAAAQANPSVFYDADGQARSVKAIYGIFAEKFNSQSIGQALAQSQGSSPETPSNQLTQVAMNTQSQLSHPPVSSAPTQNSSGTPPPIKLASFTPSQTGFSSSTFSPNQSLPTTVPSSFIMSLITTQVDMYRLSTQSSDKPNDKRSFSAIA